MKKFSSRPVVVYDLSLSINIQILHPEQVVLRFGDCGSVDVGALCYLHRGANQRKAANEGQKVDLGSFSDSRAKRVTGLIEYISTEYAYSGNRAKTLHGKFLEFVSSFMGWADTNSHINVLDDEAHARFTFHEYLIHLRRKVSQNLITTNSAARQQSRVLYRHGLVL